jgi:dTDP-4-dehydrorhamnose reductase
MTRILLTGRGGQVGRELLPLLSSQGDVVALGRGDCDLASAEAIARAVRDARPEIIVNAAAYTDVDGAESNAKLAYAVNGKAPGVLASLARDIGAVLIHYSTDYVFDGRKKEAWVESDPTAPLNVYGASKLAGERAVAAAGGRYLIFRTSWVYAAHGKNFLRTICRLAYERDELRIVNDQVGAPTSARQIAAATARVVQELAASDARFPVGVYHLTAAGSTSWFDFARTALGGNEISPRWRVRRLVPISSSDYPTKAKRPMNSVLSNRKFRDQFGFGLQSWEVELPGILKEIPEIS